MLQSNQSTATEDCSFPAQTSVARVLHISLTEQARFMLKGVLNGIKLPVTIENAPLYDLVNTVDVDE